MHLICEFPNSNVSITENTIALLRTLEPTPAWLGIQRQQQFKQLVAQDHGDNLCVVICSCSVNLLQPPAGHAQR